MLRQHTAGVKLPTNTRHAVSPVNETVRRLVVERGHLGITNKLLQHAAKCDTNRAASVLAAMARNGEIHAAHVPGVVRHWFASAELAMRWKTSTTPPPSPSPRPRQRMVKMDRIKEPTDAQNVAMVRRQQPVVTIKGRASNTDTPATVPASVKPQRGPSVTHDARYQCAPGERPYGAGFAAAGIGRDATTGLAWGQRA